MTVVTVKGSAQPSLHLVLKFRVCLQVLVLSGLEFYLCPLKSVQRSLSVLLSVAVKASWQSLCLCSLEAEL